MITIAVNNQYSSKCQKYVKNLKLPESWKKTRFCDYPLNNRGLFGEIPWNFSFIDKSVTERSLMIFSTALANDEPVFLPVLLLQMTNVFRKESFMLRRKHCKFSALSFSCVFKNKLGEKKKYIFFLSFHFYICTNLLISVQVLQI